MRTVTYGAACSLDGYIAGSGGAIDWLHFSRDVEDIMAEYWTTVDAVLMGGGELGGSLFEAGVIDEVSLNVHPVLLGSGVPFFRPQPHRIALELAESRTLDGGCVLMTYRVRN
jgi:dihydrofolate reductase